MYYTLTLLNAFSYTKIEISIIIPSYYTLFNYSKAYVLLLCILNIFNCPKQQVSWFTANKKFRCSSLDKTSNFNQKH